MTAEIVCTFVSGVREATAAFRMLQKVKEVKAEEEEKKIATRPRPYKHIKVSISSAAFGSSAMDGLLSLQVLSLAFFSLRNLQECR